MKTAYVYGRRRVFRPTAGLSDCRVGRVNITTDQRSPCSLLPTHIMARIRTTLWLLAVVAFAHASVLPRNADQKGKNGAVVSEVAECSDVGVRMLMRGGSAADAIIATGLCVGTINAFHCGIGGGGFMLVRSQGKQGRASYETIDFRETMPALGNETMYSNNTNPTASTVGGLS
ncbi:hypothetical protein BDZ89DRAFT_813918, partial [Hymenopellis radicata]